MSGRVFTYISHHGGGMGVSFGLPLRQVSAFSLSAGQGAHPSRQTALEREWPGQRISGREIPLWPDMARPLKKKIT